MLEALSGQLEGGRPLLSRTIGCWAPESEVADLLGETERAHPWELVQARDESVLDAPPLAGDRFAREVHDRTGAVDLRVQLLLRKAHPIIAHSLVLGGVRFDLGAGPIA